MDVICAFLIARRYNACGLAAKDFSGYRAIFRKLLSETQRAKRLVFVSEVVVWLGISPMRQVTVP